MVDERFRFSTTLEVRWRDVDAMGHVNNAVYFSYLEQARLHYLRKRGFTPARPADIGIMIAEASGKSRSPLALSEQVTIYARVSALRKSSFFLEYHLHGEDDRLVATARTVQVCYDYTQGRPIPIPDQWRAAITTYEPGLWPATTIDQRRRAHDDP